MITVVIDEKFIMREEEIADRLIREAIDAGNEPDLRRIERKAFVRCINETINNEMGQ